MKLMYFLAFLAFFSVGVWRAFTFSADQKVYLKPKQKAEVIYRNLQNSEKLWAVQDAAYSSYETQLGNVIEENPFMNKKDRAWVTSKIKETKTKSSKMVSLRTVKK
jgi:CTP:phosphocholine cytidylyltransferase-like protein